MKKYYFILFFTFIYFLSTAQAPLFKKVQVSDFGTNNNIGDANTSRNLAITSDGIIYAVYAGSNGVRVSKSIDRGQSFESSVQVSRFINTEPEIAVNDEGIIFVSWVQSGNLYFSRSVDQGNTFSTPKNLGSVLGSFDFSIHMTTFEKNVYIRDVAGTNFFRNNNNGIGDFITETIPLSAGRDIFADVRTDINGVVHFPSDDPTLYLFNSTDNGNTINEVSLSPRGSVFFSSYALSDSPAGTFIFVAGQGSTGYKIEAETGISTPINFKNNSRNGRTIFADNFGALVDGYKEGNSVKMSISYDQGITFPIDIIINRATSHNIDRNPFTDDLNIIYEEDGEIFMDVFDGLLRSVRIIEPIPSFDVCQDDSLSVPFSLTGTFSVDSEFILFLSDENGSFENKTQIGAIITDKDDSFDVKIPTNINSSDKYRLQIQSPANFIQSNIIPISIGTILEIGAPNNILECTKPNGKANFDLTSQEVTIANGLSGLNFEYFPTEDDAKNNLNKIINTSSFESEEVTIWVRIKDNSTKCPLSFTLSNFELKFKPSPIINKELIDYKVCDSDASGSDTDGFTNFDLTLKIDEILSGKDPNDFIIEFYTDNTRSTKIISPENFENTIKDSQKIYVSVSEKDDVNCFSFTDFEIVVSQLPTLKKDTITITECDDDNDGTSTFNINGIKSELSGNSVNETFKYYTSLTLANSGTPNTEISIPSSYTISITDPSEVYVRIENNTNCFRTAKINLQIESPINIGTPENIEECALANGKSIFDLTTQEASIINGLSGVTIDYFTTQIDAENDTSKITTPSKYESDATTIWVRLNAPAQKKCSQFEITSFDLVIKTVPKISNSIENLKTCDSNTVGSDIDGFTSFDLTTKIDDILIGKDPNNFTVDFYTDSSRTKIISLPQNYVNTTKDIETIYVRVIDKKSITCASDTQFNIEVTTLPNLTSSNIILKQCDDDSDGISIFNLNEANQLLSSNFENETFTYYFSSSNAEAGIDGTEILNSNSYSNPIALGSKVYARIENKNNCYRTAEVNLAVGVSNLPESFFNSIDIKACDDGIIETEYLDGFSNFDLTNVVSEANALFPPNSVTTTLYTNQEDALSELNKIEDISNFRNTLKNSQTIYIRVDGNTNNDCQGFGNFVINVIPIPSKKEIDRLLVCGKDSELEFDLTLKESSIIDGQPNLQTFYYQSALDRENDIAITNPTNFLSESRTIFVKVVNTVTTCENNDIQFEIVTEDVEINEPEKINQCNLITPTEYNLTIRENEIANGNTNLTFEYFESQDAVDNNLKIEKPQEYISTTLNKVIIVKATNENNCSGLVNLQLETTLFASINTTPTPLEICDTDNDGFDVFNLKEIENTIIEGTGQNLSDFNFIYYQIEDDALEGNRKFIAEPNTFNIRIPNRQTVFVRVEQFNGECFKVVPFNIIVNPRPIISNNLQYVICNIGQSSYISDLSTTIPQLPIQTGLSKTLFSFQWFKGDSIDVNDLIDGENSASYNPEKSGIYTVLISNKSTSCSSVSVIEVLDSFNPETISIAMVSEIFKGNNSIRIDVTGNGTYEYSLNNQDWQESNEFSNLDRGEVEVYVRDIYNCDLKTESFTIIDFPSFFTPNNDGINDTWNITSSETIKINNINIFNRYGKLLKQLLPNSSAWDGTSRGAVLPSDNYWFLVEYTNTSNNISGVFKSTFTLKR